MNEYASPITVQCPQCGYLHPPLQAGEICPIAKQTEIPKEVESFLSSIRNLVLDCLEKKVPISKDKLDRILAYALEQLHN